MLGRRAFLPAGLGLMLLAWVLGRGKPPAPRPPTGAFASPSSCAALLNAGQRLPRARGTARLASWNLRWFPDGGPGESARGTDLGWMACVLSWLDADVIAVQEVKGTPRAQQALDTMLDELSRLSAGRYMARLDDCGTRVPQHVGLIWNEARVTATAFETVGALNPSGSACANQLRPGLGARLRFPGGLDLQVISAHFKSLTDEHGFSLRSRSFAALPGVLRSFVERTGDTDLLLLGDLNTMGCDECSPPLPALKEVEGVAARLAGSGLRLVAADAAGSEWSVGRLTLLDHAIASAALRELAPETRAHVVGPCAPGSAPTTRRAAKQLARNLSDHCPITLDLVDRDLDLDSEPK